MLKVLFNPFIYDIVPKTTNIEVAKIIALQNEIGVGLVKSLEEVRNSCFAAKLTTKHVSLTAIVNNIRNNVSCRQKVCTLALHH